MPLRSYQAGRFTWVFPCLKSLAPLGSRLPALSRSRSRRAPFIEDGETLDGATAIVTGAGYGSPYSFTVASARRPRGPGQGQRAAVCGHAEGCRRLRCARGTHHARSGRLRRQVADAFTASGLTLVHVNFSQFAGASSNATASAS
jgi:hypothetical protein